MNVPLVCFDPTLWLSGRAQMQTPRPGVTALGDTPESDNTDAVSATPSNSQAGNMTKHHVAPSEQCPLEYMCLRHPPTHLAVGVLDQLLYLLLPLYNDISQRLTSLSSWLLSKPCGHLAKRPRHVCLHFAYPSPPKKRVGVGGRGVSLSI